MQQGNRNDTEWLCKVKKIPKIVITLEVGGWVQVSFKKKEMEYICSQNSPIIVLICWDSIPCVSCLYVRY